MTSLIIQSRDREEEVEEEEEEEEEEEKICFNIIKWFKVTDEPRQICVHLADVYGQSYVSGRIVCTKPPFCKWGN